MLISEFTETVIATGEQTTNRLGNRMFQIFRPADRYVIDFATDFFTEGWQQFDTDQDASYFGVWMNPHMRYVLTYAEGDWTLVYCQNKNQYNAEVRSAIDFFEEGQIAVAIDREGKVTRYSQDRDQFLVN